MNTRRHTVINYIAIFMLAFLLTGCGNPFRKPELNDEIDRTTERKVSSYQNQSYDWVHHYVITQWINRPLWEDRIQPGIVKTERGWGIYGYDKNWIQKPNYSNIYRPISTPEKTYPEKIFARLETENKVYLIDSTGQLIASYDEVIDPYEAINRVKSLKVRYVQEYGSIFSVKKEDSSVYNTDLNSYVSGRFSELDWATFEPTEECSGWIVRLRGSNNEIYRQQWLVTKKNVHNLTSDRRDYIRTSAVNTTKNCLKIEKVTDKVTDDIGTKHVNVSANLRRK